MRGVICGGVESAIIVEPESCVCRIWSLVFFRFSPYLELSYLHFCHFRLLMTKLLLVNVMMVRV